MTSIADKAPSFQTTNGDVIAYAEELHDHAATPHKPWLALVARLLRAACPDDRAPVVAVALVPLVPDPLEPVQRRFSLATGGADVGLDNLAIVVALLKELDHDDRAATLAYVVARFGGEVT